MGTQRLALFLCCWLVAPAAPLAAETVGSGFAMSPNFTVMTPRHHSAEQAEQFADQVLEAAERLRREIALEWLGEAIPESQGRTIVTVSFEPTRDVGLTWAVDRPQRRYHSLVLVTSPQLATNNTLAHEMVHIVLATRFPPPGRLPIWIEEGIAGRYDDHAPRQVRQQVIARCVQTQRWPSIDSVFTARTFQATDTEAYTVATSVTDLLLARDGDKRKFVAFGNYGHAYGWDAALHKYYGIAGVSQLQMIWQQQLTSTATAPAIALLERR